MHTCVCMYIQIQNRTHLCVFIYTYLCMCSLCLLAVCTRVGFVLGSTGGHQLCDHMFRAQKLTTFNFFCRILFDIQLYPQYQQKGWRVVCVSLRAHRSVHYAY